MSLFSPSEILSGLRGRGSGPLRRALIAPEAALDLPPSDLAADVVPPFASPAGTPVASASRFAEGQLLWESSYAAASSIAETVPPHAGGFVVGTRVINGSGSTLVQALRVGDTVTTAAGLRRQVRWIGRRAYHAATMDAHPHLRPVLLRAGSLGPGLPETDLRLAPTHLVRLEDPALGPVLIPAASLVNGRTILRPAAPDPLVYLHVELNTHDLLLAEGVAAETYIDQNNRAMFHNAAEFDALYPRRPALDTRPCVKRIDEGDAIERIRTRLAPLAAAPPAGPARITFVLERWRGGLQGYALDETCDTPVQLDILLDGHLHAKLPANHYRPDLDHANLNGGRCGFTCPLPARAGHIAIRHGGARALYRSQE